ncbi:uncharacterized protein LOC141591578 [Silene latifolia]|uniref:uncharacterized protein LOC141591578 n=1 Tax=Silene latifolia TaxID=37657 RepID=UPI003D7787DC
MAFRSIINELRGVKVKEVPEKLKPYLTLTFIKESIAKGIDNYHAKYIVTNSAQPLFHVCYGGMIFSYLVALPEERRHLAHQEEHAKHAAAAH